MRTEAIKLFLTKHTHADLAKSYTAAMECQVNVAADGGTRTTKEYKGRTMHGYTDGATEWKSFRIPYKANSTPEYQDVPMSFDLQEHAEAIGMTGWDWQNKRSLWVAYDFDAIIGHKNVNRLDPDTINQVALKAKALPWVTVRRSTGGSGLHLYVYLDPPIETQNHTEHAALARAILSKMSGLTGFDFNAKVDACGGNMWVWHRKMGKVHDAAGNRGLELLHPGDPLADVPLNWREHIQVTSKNRAKVQPQAIPAMEAFDLLSSTKSRTALDDTHRALMEFLNTRHFKWWWDNDNHILVTHTFSLKQAALELKYVGDFDTVASGSEGGNDHNCFAHPLPNGGWIVRRFTQRCPETSNWSIDTRGWTKCYLNREHDLHSAAAMHGGMDDPSGGYAFKSHRDAFAALAKLHITVEDPFGSGTTRNTRVIEEPNSRLLIEIERVPSDNNIKDWISKPKKWVRIVRLVNQTVDDKEGVDTDFIVRHLVVDNKSESGWSIKTLDAWQSEPIEHIRLAMTSLGYERGQIQDILGSCVMQPWRLVVKPFQPEYPGDREWNRDAAQFRVKPTLDMDNLHYPTWSAILEHTGQGLDEAVREDAWCKSNNVLTGADYLKMWAAAVFQYPERAAPYLFFFGPQNSGKSIFHEALSLLLTNGYHRADSALINDSGFNGELENCILAVVEEVDLRKNRDAYNRIKDFVTGARILIHRKGCTPYMSTNCTHWIQCSNHAEYCPVGFGDSRIVVVAVNDLPAEKRIGKSEIMSRLSAEAPNFLAEILNIEIPRINDRLSIPVITTQDKLQAAENSLDIISNFYLSEICLMPGAMINANEAYQRFVEYSAGGAHIGKNGFFQRMSSMKGCVKGRSMQTNQVMFANVCWLKDKDTMMASDLWKLTPEGVLRR